MKNADIDQLDITGNCVVLIRDIPIIILYTFSELDKMSGYGNSYAPALSTGTGYGYTTGNKF